MSSEPTDLNIDWIGDDLDETDRQFLDAFEEKMRVESEAQKLKSLVRNRASFGEQLLALFTVVPMHVGEWNEMKDEFLVYDWDCFVCHVTNYGNKVEDQSKTNETIINSFRSAGVCLEVDVDPNNSHTDNDSLIHKIHHPLLRQHDYEMAARLGWFGPVAVINDHDIIDRRIQLEMFPELEDFETITCFESIPMQQ